MATGNLTVNRRNGETALSLNAFFETTMTTINDTLSEEITTCGDGSRFIDITLEEFDSISAGIENLDDILAAVCHLGSTKSWCGLNEMFEIPDEPFWDWGIVNPPLFDEEEYDAMIELWEALATPSQLVVESQDHLWMLDLITKDGVREAGIQAGILLDQVTGMFDYLRDMLMGASPIQNTQQYQQWVVNIANGNGIGAGTNASGNTAWTNIANNPLFSYTSISPSQLGFSGGGAQLTQLLSTRQQITQTNAKPLSYSGNQQQFQMNTGGFGRSNVLNAASVAALTSASNRRYQDQGSSQTSLVSSQDRTLINLNNNPATSARTFPLAVSISTDLSQARHKVSDVQSVTKTPLIGEGQPMQFSYALNWANCGIERKLGNDQLILGERLYQFKIKLVEGQGDTLQWGESIATASTRAGALPLRNRVAYETFNGTGVLDWNSQTTAYSTEVFDGLGFLQWRTPTEREAGAAIAAREIFDTGFPVGAYPVRANCSGGSTSEKTANLSDQFNGSNQTFTMPEAYSSGSLRTFWNGQRLTNTEMVVEESSTTFRLTVIGSASDVLLVDYKPSSSP